MRPAVPGVEHRALLRSLVDAFVLESLEQKKLSLNPEADRATLLRRLSFDLTGLPPKPDEIAQFIADPAPDAYSRLVERLLSSPHYGERWGKYWLDVAGYADSNGYFNADSDRPLAYKYRDYVIRSFNGDRPFDQFVREQLAGDELSGHRAGQPLTRDVVDQFTATHFLRNGQDGSSESDGNPDELRVDRATVLHGTLQLTMNSLLGVTIQCCRCHEHKFEPIAAAEYYQLESIFYPAFPAYDAEHWVAPKNRVREMPAGDEAVVWRAHEHQIDAEKARAVHAYASWVETHRPPEAILFRDEFKSPGRLSDSWWSPTPESHLPARSVPSPWILPLRRPLRSRRERSASTNPTAAIVGSSLAKRSIGGRATKESGSRPPSTWWPIGSQVRPPPNASLSSSPPKPMTRRESAARLVTCCWTATPRAKRP